MSASNVVLYDTNVSNFVSVKLSGNNYLVWKSQMLCLLDSNNMGGIVDDKYVGPRFSCTETERQYNSLAKGWILGSVSEDVLADVHHLDSAKAVWEKLKSNYDPIVCQQKDSTSKKSDVEAEKEVDRDANSADTIIVEEGADSIKITVDPTETDTKKEDKQNHENKMDLDFSVYERLLRRATTSGDWPWVERMLAISKFPLDKRVITWDGSTILHMAVGLGHKDFIEQLCSYLTDDQVLQKRETDGSTALHIAAIVGNTHAADILVKKNRELLRIKNKNGIEPLKKAYEHMHLDTILYLLKAVNDDAETESQSYLAASIHPDDEIGVGLLVNAISAKQYSLALELVQKFPMFASKSDEVLMAIAKNFPSGLDNWETLVYPTSWDDVSGIMSDVAKIALTFLLWPVIVVVLYINDEYPISTLLYNLVILTVPAWLVSSFLLICLFILIIPFTFLSLYSLWWKGAKILFPPIKRIEDKKKDMEEAERVLSLVCTEIDNLKNYDHYTQPILEATCQNSYEVVNQILLRSPATIKSKDKNGYDIIQLAIMNRSEKIYNLIYDFGEHKNVYRTCKDSSENNILHLAGKLAPSSVLNRRTGAALQLQRELQWLQEVEKIVFPSFITQENISKETPYMVFTREHKDLKKEGEQWMKATAESCSITAALIITIVFAAAITVPGGNNQEKGTPLFKNQVAFIIFAIADAISLFASSTSLLVFLSILTTRFAETDFLVRLPRRLFIGLFSLLLSTTTMMVAFSATLFLVFCDNKPWMLAPICGLAFIPIAFFVTLQFPLMVDLFRSTYLPIFGKQKQSMSLVKLIEEITKIVEDLF